MDNKVFTINKGINKPLEFRGLKAQYIGHLAVSVVGSLVVFAILYISGVSDFIAVPLTLVLGGVVIARVYRISKKYGQYGLMKRGARKAVPVALLSRSRKFFTQLAQSYVRTLK
jgi:hypothetical protein